MTKEKIRNIIKVQKKLITENDKNEAASKVFWALEQSAIFSMSKNILCYHSLVDEISTLSFINKWYNDKALFLPRVNGDTLDILPYDNQLIQQGAFNIIEPMGNNPVDIGSIDLIIVPAVALDRQGNRVGRGKGYYDRLLINAHAVTIGIGYDFQLVDTIECENHDVRMDYIITPSNFIKSKF